MSSATRFWMTAAVLACLAPAAKAEEAWRLPGIMLTTDQLDEAFPALASGPDGSTVVAWQQFGRIYAQKVTLNGEIAPAWPAATGLGIYPGSAREFYDPYEQCGPRIASDGAGGAFVLWHDGRNSGCLGHCSRELRRLFVERVSAEGAIAPNWPETGLQIGSAPGDMVFIEFPRTLPWVFNTTMVPDGEGGIYVAWQEHPPFSGDDVNTIRVQRVSHDGRLLFGPRGSLACKSKGDHLYPVLCLDGSGGVYAVWEEHLGVPMIPPSLWSPPFSPTTGIWGQHLSARGELSWGASGRRLSSSGANNGDHQVCSDGQGGGFLVWSVSDSVGTKVLARRFPSDVLRPADDMELAANLRTKPQPQVARDAFNGAWYVWVGSGAAGKQANFVQHVVDHRTWTAFSQSHPFVVGDDPFAKFNLRIVSDGKGGAFLAWMAIAPTFVPRAVHLLPGGTLDPVWPQEGLHLEDPVSGSYELEMIPDGFHGAIVAWERLREDPDGNDLVLLQRLVTGKTILATPNEDSLTPGLRLDGFTPNPGDGNATVTLELPGSDPAALELFDLTGRRLARVDVLGAGTHVLRIADMTRRVTPGVYFLCLRSGATTVTRRGLVLP